MVLDGDKQVAPARDRSRALIPLYESSARRTLASVRLAVSWPSVKRPKMSPRGL